LGVVVGIDLGGSLTSGAAIHRGIAASSESAHSINMQTAYDFKASDIDGNERALREFEGLALLIVNVASKCGFTPQYAGLEALWRKHRDRGFAILGFPCDQFGHQEPGNEAEIKQFCELNYGATFPMFAKIDVNGAGAHPLYRWLKSEQPGLLGTEAIKWNFTKFLVDRGGHVAKRYAPTDTPEKIDKDIEALLANVAR
jgi:glutathione peroxidase